MAHKSHISKSEWAFLLAWVQIAEYLDMLPELGTIQAGDINYGDLEIVSSDDPQSDCCRSYRSMSRTIRMETPNRIPRIVVNADLNGLSVDSLSGKESSGWEVADVRVRVGENKEPYYFHYQDSDHLRPCVVYGYPDKTKLWDINQNKYCFTK